MIYIYYSLICLPFAMYSHRFKLNQERIIFFTFVIIGVFLVGFSYKSGSDWVNYLGEYATGCDSGVYEGNLRRSHDRL